MMGDVFRSDFLMMLNDMGEPMTVFRNHGTSAQTETKAKALLGSNENGKPNSCFSFADALDIKPGDIIKPDAARDHYRVTETTDHTEGGTFIEFAVYVVKADASQPSVKSDTHVHNYAPVYGQQVATNNSTQTVTVNAQLNHNVAGLRKAVSDSNLSDFAKEDAQRDIDRIDALAKREQTPEVKGKLGKLLDGLEVTAQVSDKAAKIIKLWVGVFLEGTGLGGTNA